ncbi:unnamed protein product [Boreogadus saida]
MLYLKGARENKNPTQGVTLNSFEMTSSLSADSVTTPQGVLTRAHLGQGVLTRAHLGQGVLTRAHLGQGVLTRAHLGQGVLTRAHLGQGGKRS